MTALETRLAAFRDILLARQAAKSTVSSPTPPPSPVAGTKPADLADAVAAALSRFTDEDGSLRVRTTNGGSPA